MPVVLCPRCGEELQIENRHFSATVQCPGCRTQFRASSGEPARDFSWDQIAAQVHDPWGAEMARVAPEWATSDQLEHEALPDGVPPEAAALGQPLASLRVGFGEHRLTLLLGWGLVSAAILTLAGAAWIVVFFPVQGRPLADATELLSWMGLAVLTAGGLGFLTLYTAHHSSPPVRFWLCPGGLIWEVKGEIRCCTWQNVLDLQSGARRIIRMKRGSLFEEDQIEGREETWTYLIALPGGDAFQVSTAQTRLARPFMERAQFEIIQALVPACGRRLDAGETLTIGPFRINRGEVQHAQNRATWSELERIDVVKGAVLLGHVDGSTWAAEPLHVIPHAPVFVKMVEVLLDAHRDSRPQGPPDPFAF
jgi:hypothetical protein